MITMINQDICEQISGGLDNNTNNVQHYDNSTQGWSYINDCNSNSQIAWITALVSEVIASGAAIIYAFRRAAKMVENLKSAANVDGTV